MLTPAFISLSTLFEWFFGGSLIMQIFRVIALVGLCMAVLLAVINLFGGDHEISDGDGGHILSFPTVSGFLLGLGAVGSILLEKGYSVVTAALAGVGSGFLIGGTFLLIMRLFSSLKEDNTFRIESCIGTVGTVYVRIPAGETGGQIQVVAQSRMVTLPALASEDLPSGTKVRVVEVMGHDTVKVERVV